MLLSAEALHIPDGFLSITISFLAWIISILIVGYALRRVGKDLGEQQVPMMGVLAAAIFAGQMINFVVAGGTSGHLMGAALATILMGPWAAILVMTSVVSIQALIFQDGGLLVLGANIFNMAVVGVSVAYMVYRLLLKITGDTRKGILVSGFSAGWFSIILAALSVALQLVVSGTSPARLAIPAMAGVHALIGIGEGLITVGALAFLLSARPDLIHPDQTKLDGSRSVWVLGFLLTVALLLAAPLASVRPDGLEWVAMQTGFIEMAREPLYELVPDYLVPGIANESIATILAGALGILIIFGLGIGIAYSRRKSQISGK
ncbi:MAG: energy-coupling factor ABC transporter permease [Anaerolineales bacterium]|nr:energy-coupling factor ABC transporter permease [Anaerolineales bacterium]